MLQKTGAKTREKKESRIAGSQGMEARAAERLGEEVPSLESGKSRIPEYCLQELRIGPYTTRVVNTWKEAQMYCLLRKALAQRGWRLVE